MTQIIKAKNADGTILASSEKSTHQVYQVDGHWYFHPEQVNTTFLKETKRSWNCPDKGIAYWYDLETSDVQSQNVAWIYPKVSDEFSYIADYIGFWGIETHVSVVEMETDSL